MYQQHCIPYLNLQKYILKAKLQPNGKCLEYLWDCPYYEVLWYDGKKEIVQGTNIMDVIIRTCDLTKHYENHLF